uniref:G-protein coupled receptors family 1 profile domain-containing protein n=1 Tax=Plectus sambesii TaxID=2011161 RepID=A0A914XDV6_9BILA
MDEQRTSFDSMLANTTLEEQSQWLKELRAHMEITDVLPPPNHEDLHVIIMAIVYMLLFLVGTCGNVGVLTAIHHVVRTRSATVDNTLVYVIVLSCVDFGVCLSLPFTVIDQILGFWMFGSVVCKMHAVLENVGKILSALILTAMAFDRYASVCLPQRKSLRSRRFAVFILIGLALYATVTLCPMLWSFTARELILFEKETGPMRLTRMRIEKCTMVDFSTFMFTGFTIYQCILCYCIPLFLVAFFYSKLLYRLRQHARQFTSSHIPLLRISLYTLAVACFYFVCWTPFWIATVFAIYLEFDGAQGGSVPPIFVYCMYFIHALPFTNSAINFILYGALNGQLQQKHSSAREMNTYPNMSVVGLRTQIETPMTNRHKITTSTQTTVDGHQMAPDDDFRAYLCDVKDELHLLTGDNARKDSPTECYLSQLYAFLSLDSYEVRMLQHHDPTFL